MPSIDFTDSFTFQKYEELLDAAADLLRGRRLDEEEWQKCRALWAGLGMVLAPCWEPGKKKDNIEDDFDRAMEFLK